MNVKPVVIRVDPEMNSAATYELGSGKTSFAAAPFDTPTHVIISDVGDGTLVAEFSYALGANEGRKAQQLQGVTAKVGTISGRIMQLVIPVDRYEVHLADAAEGLKIRQHELARAAGVGQPLRVAAHYGLVGAQLLPVMNKHIADEVLPELRRLTNR